MIVSCECKAPDIVCVHGTKTLSRLIRFFTREKGEPPTVINHVGVIVDPGIIYETKLVEALKRVVHRKLWAYSSTKSKVAIYRPTNLTEDEIKIIRQYAMDQVGKTYGYIKLVTHFLDFWLGGAYVFRRLTNMQRYPICSWLVAHAYAQAGKNFGVEPGAATPDDIWDFLLANPQIYTMIHPLKHLKD